MGTFLYIFINFATGFLLSHDIKKIAKVFKLELYDCIIVATAILHDQILVTRNAKHYPDKRLKLFIPEY